MTTPREKDYERRPIRYAEMMAALRDAPCSADDLHEISGMAASHIRKLIHALRETVPPMVYIEHWDKEHDSRQFKPFYRLRLKKEKDAIRPSLEPGYRKARAEIVAANKRKQRAEERAFVNAQAGMKVDGRSLKTTNPNWREIRNDALRNAQD